MGAHDGGAITTLFPQTTCRVSEALDRIGQHRFGCEWTGEEINARHLPEPGKMKEVEGKGAQDLDGEEHRAEQAAYLRYRTVRRTLINALRYGYTRSWIITPEGERIDIPAHWWEPPMQLIVGAFFNPSDRSQLGFSVDTVKILDHSGPNLLELIRSASASQDSGFRWKDSRDKGRRLKDPSIAGAKGVLYIDQEALDKGLQKKEEGVASGDVLPTPDTAGAEGPQPKAHAETAKLRGELKTWIEESTRVEGAERLTKADFLQQAREEVDPQITKHLFNEVWRTAEIPADFRKAGAPLKRV